MTSMRVVAIVVLGQVFKCKTWLGLKMAKHPRNWERQSNR